MDCKAGCFAIVPGCCLGGLGTAPAIGENGNWWIGDEDTGVKAQGNDGITPHIGENGNWFIGDADTGVKAEGVDGQKGDSGEPGPAGPQGPIGPQGPKGDSGLMEEVYSTKATRIGTWIDGRPLYRRSFMYQGAIPAVAVDQESITDVVPASQLEDVHWVVKVHGVATHALGAGIPFPNIRLSALYVPSAGIRIQSSVLT